jgi:hypothetical protein
MIETIGLAASCTLFISLIGFFIFTGVIILAYTDYDPYFWRKKECDAWCAYMTFSWFIAISLVLILVVLP